MRIALRMLLAASFGVVALQRAGAADDKPAFKDDKEKASYAVGIFFGNQLKRSNMDVDMNVVLGAASDVLAGKDLRLTEADASQTLRAYQQESRRKLAEKNKTEGDTFLEENKKKPG